MKKTMTLMVLLGGLLLASEAQAGPPLQLQLRVEPVTDAAQLAQLMRQNSVRIALQRHRLWQAAVRHEEQREQSQQRHRYRHRKRVQKGATTAAMAPAPAPMVATPPKPAPMATTAVKRAAPMVAPPSQARTRTRATVNLRELLRKGRLGDADALERKLRARIREQQRQREQLRKREQQGSGKGSRRGGRGGR